jgi:hypothetical protein
MARSPEEFAAAVERGAQLLDRWNPDWFRYVETERLHMRSCGECIVGQIAENLLRLEVPDSGETYVTARGMIGMDCNPASYGITLDCAEFCANSSVYWDILRDLWIAQIDHRQQSSCTESFAEELLEAVGA